MESSNSLEMPLIFDCSRIVLPAASMFEDPRVIENLAYYGSLVARPVPRYWNRLGSDLEELQSAQRSLYSWEHVLRAYWPAEMEAELAPSLPTISICGLQFGAGELESYLRCSDLSCATAVPSFQIAREEFALHDLVALPFEQIAAFFAAHASAKSPSIAPKRLLCWVLNGAELRTLLQRIAKRIQRIKEILYQRINIFCGLSWSRRLWFLLHGSHPPKLGLWLVQRQWVECAVL